MPLHTKSVILDAQGNLPTNEDGELAFATNSFHRYLGRKNGAEVHIITGPNLSMESDHYPSGLPKTGALPAFAGGSNVKLFPYAASAYHRPMWSQIDSSAIVGSPYAFQPFLAQKKVGWWTANGLDTTISVFGMLNTTAGTVTSRSMSTGTVLGATRRVGFVTANTAGSSAGTRHSQVQWFRGSASGGGYHYIVRFGIAATTATTRWFVGLRDSGAVIGNVNPSTLLNMIGFGIDSGQTTVRAFQNDGAGAATATDLGANFPATTTDVMYEAGIFTYKNSTQVAVYLQRYDSAQLYTGVVSSDQPSGTTFLAPHVWINNGANTGQPALDVISQYIETDR